MPSFGSGPDRQLVEKLTVLLNEIVVTPFQTDDRIPGYLMPADAKLKPKVFVAKWTPRNDRPDVYAAMIERGEPPTPKGKPYEWHPPATPLGLVWIGWPGEPDEAALAYKVGEWLLILDGRQKAKFHIKLG